MSADSAELLAVSAPRRALEVLGRGLAMLVLVCAIVPVGLLGPALVRAPYRLARQLDADVVRAARSLSSSPRAASHASQGAARPARHAGHRAAGPTRRASQSSGAPTPHTGQNGGQR